LMPSQKSIHEAYSGINKLFISVGNNYSQRDFYLPRTHAEVVAWKCKGLPSIDKEDLKVLKSDLR